MTTTLTINYFVTGDTNDGDYTTEVFNATKYCEENNITLEELDKRIRKFVAILKENDEGYNWSNEYSDYSVEQQYPTLFEEGDYKEEWMFIEDLLPYGENGIHTISKIVKSVGTTEEIFNND